ncbi:DUF4352 domain-containing protein [Priestia aryabhattai]|uniref:DUF4352 domain-containing protein n=1 Tax=Priestia aryabhattai TaxID=412384 RepID=A0AAX6NCZ1_PRIAR|nr:DUF4352 domain-containing protein [Priestia aryabhattai]MDU9693596.1 DUF4352 domain-containing protein [Priestia aryabhattai]
MAKDKKKKSIFKRWWFWVLVIIVIIAIATGGGKSDDTQTTSNNKEGKQTESSSNKTSNSKSTKEASSFGMNEEVKVGKMTYKVTSKTTADQVGPSVMPEKANQKYVVLELSIKNGGEDAVTVDSTFFKLKRAGKTYEADAMASMSANQDESGNITNSFFAQGLNPDSEMSGKVVFDVAPEVANASDLQLQVQTGAFGTQTELINLK